MKDPAGYTFNSKWTIPAYMGEGLMRWVEHGVPPGDFLQAVLKNDLMKALGRADLNNLANLPAYGGWLYNEAPSDCYGSPEKYDAWAKAKQQEQAKGVDHA